MLPQNLLKTIQSLVQFIELAQRSGTYTLEQSSNIWKVILELKAELEKMNVEEQK